MSELILARPQHLVVQKIASYFKQSVKKVRAALDIGAYEETKVLSFPAMAESELVFTSKFYCAQGAFNINHILDREKFKKSAIYQAYLNYTCTPAYEQGAALAYVTTTGGVVIGYEPGVCVSKGDGVIVLAYDYLAVEGLHLHLIKGYLESMYPSPLE